jgi:hypothetical protein
LLLVGARPVFCTSTCRGLSPKIQDGGNYWAHEIAGIVTKISGVEVQVAARVGGHSDVLWVTRLENMAAVEKLMDQLQAAPDYDASIRQALAKGLFETHSIEQAFWRTA